MIGLHCYCIILFMRLFFVTFLGKGILECEFNNFISIKYEPHNERVALHRASLHRPLATSSAEKIAETFQASAIDIRASARPRHHISNSIAEPSQQQQTFHAVSSGQNEGTGNYGGRDDVEGQLCQCGFHSKFVGGGE